MLPPGSRKKNPARVGAKLAGRTIRPTCQSCGKNRLKKLRSVSQRSISLRLCARYQPTGSSLASSGSPHQSLSVSARAASSRSERRKEGPLANSHAIGRPAVMRTARFWCVPNRMPPVSTPPWGARGYPSTAAVRISSSAAREYSMRTECPGTLHVSNLRASDASAIMPFQPCAQGLQITLNNVAEPEHFPKGRYGRLRRRRIGHPILRTVITRPIASRACIRSAESRTLKVSRLRIVVDPLDNEFSLAEDAPHTQESHVVIAGIQPDMTIKDYRSSVSRSRKNGSERESDETATFTQLSSPAELRGTDVGHRHPLGHG